MRFFALLVASAVAIVSAQAPSPACNVALLTPLLTDPNVALCTADSGLSLPPAPGVISTAALTKACASMGCKNLIAKVASLNLGDCSVGTFKIETDFLTPLKTACGSNAEDTNSTQNNSTGTNNIETPATTAPTVPSPAPSSTPSPAPTSGATALTFTTGATIVVVTLMALW